MNNIFGITDTITLIEAVEQFKKPATYLTETFFNQKMPVANTSWIGFEVFKGKRQLAPHIVRGGRGKDIGRENVDAKFYSAPMVGPRRVIGIKDMEMRMIGEQPIFSTLKPEERAAAMQARDLQDLLARIENTKNKMCADILTTGRYVVSGYADDGERVIEDTIDYGFTNVKTASPTWDNANAKIYDDLEYCCDKIAEDTGELPTMLLCGANVEKYMLANKEIRDWLLVNNRQNLTMASLQPKYLAPQTRYLGTLTALGLEMYSYLETYWDDATQSVKPFIPADTAIVIKPGKGKQLFGAITLMDDAGPKTYAAENVPVYDVDKRANAMSLTVYSRFLMVPEDVSDWYVIQVK